MLRVRPFVVSLLLVVALGCRASPFLPNGAPANPTDAAGIVGQLGVAFLNRFSISAIAPAECLVDFTPSCRGTSEELSDITYNRSHFEILGARLGPPTVSISANGVNANIAIPCSWDSLVTKCDEPGCVVGSFSSVAGSCTLTGVREASGWKLCTSNFSGRLITPANKNFFGPQ